MTWRVTVGGAALIFSIGATFWAGASYNRLESIEKQVNDMHTQMTQLGDLPVLKMKVEGLEVEVQRLQNQRDRDRKLQ